MQKKRKGKNKCASHQAEPTIFIDYFTRLQNNRIFHGMKNNKNNIQKKGDASRAGMLRERGSFTSPLRRAQGVALRTLFHFLPLSSERGRKKRLK